LQEIAAALLPVVIIVHDRDRAAIQKRGHTAATHQTGLSFDPEN
jgi:hypothetical protein